MHLIYDMIRESAWKAAINVRRTLQDNLLDWISPCRSFASSSMAGNSNRCNFIQLLINPCKHLILTFTVVGIVFCIHLRNSPSALSCRTVSQMHVFIFIYCVMSVSSTNSPCRITTSRICQRALRLNRNHGYIMPYTTSCVRLHPDFSM